MSGQGQVKGHSETFSSFGLSGRLDGIERGQTHPKCWIDIRKGYCISTKGIFSKGQCQGQVTKGHYKIRHKHAVRHIFSGSFCMQISMVTVI